MNPPLRNLKPAAPTRSEELRPQPGRGTRLTRRNKDFTYNAAAGKNVPGLRFRPSLQGLELRLTQGLIDGREPTIKGKPMSQATLRLDPSKVNDKGECWACLEVVPDKEGLLTDQTRREIVQDKEPRFQSAELGRCPLALIVFKKRRPVLVDPVTQWNLQYYRIKEGTAVRHLFL